MQQNTQTHYLRYDSHRSVGLDLVINGLYEAVETLHSQVLEDGYYDGVWFAEESEPIIGLAFIAFQNYINGSIYDYCKGHYIHVEEKNKEAYYKIAQNSINDKRSKIELIIGLANYAKHKDEKNLHRGTGNILKDFGLIQEGITNDYLILEGLNLLNEEGDLIQIKEFVKDWREYLWSRDE